MTVQSFLAVQMTAVGINRTRMRKASVRVAEYQYRDENYKENGVFHGCSTLSASSVSVDKPSVHFFIVKVIRMNGKRICYQTGDA